MPTHVDLSAMYLGVGGYATYRLAQHFLKKRALPAKKVVDDDDGQSAEGHEQTLTKSTETMPTPQRLHSVLPSVFSIQLAVLVASTAAALHLDLSLQPLLPALVMFTVYRVVLGRFSKVDLPSQVQTDETSSASSAVSDGSARPQASASRTSQISRQAPYFLAGAQLMVMVALAVSRRMNVTPHALLSPFFVCLLYKVLTSRPIKAPAEVKDSATGVTEIASAVKSEKEQVTDGNLNVRTGSAAIRHSVLPSPLAMQLAALVAVSAALFHVGVPCEPIKASFCMFLCYRIVLYNFAPLKKPSLKKC